MRTVFIILCLTSVLLASHVQSDELLVLTEEFKPFQYEAENGQPAGFMVELMGIVFERAGVEMEDGGVKIFPWARAYDMLLDIDNAAAFMTVRTAEREDLFKWVGPLAPREMWLFKLKDREDIQANNLEEAKTFTIGGYQSAQTDYLIELGFPDVDIAPHEKLNVQRLLKRRVDMVPSLELMMAERLRDLGVSYDTVEKVILFDDRFDYYLAINLNTPDDLVMRLQAALDEVKADGAYAQLRAKYIN
jgi:polar amino acid transport system substrate-binding protein